MKKSSGFTLLELLLALTISCSALLTTSSLLKQILLSSTRVAQREELARALFWAAEKIARDLRRTGFSHPTELRQPQLNTPLIIANHHREQAKSCVLLSYTTNLGRANTGWHVATFGYRLHQQNLEMQRLETQHLRTMSGAIDCNGSHWEDLFDPHLIRVEQFLLERQEGSLLLSLSASLVRQPQLRESLQMVVPLENLP